LTMHRQSKESLARRVAAIAFLLCLVLPHGGARAEDRVASFLSIPVDVAGAGMGGADVARSLSGIAPFSNPAGAVARRSGLGLTHGIWLAEQTVDALTVQLPLQQGRGGLALMGRMVRHASVPRFDAGGARLTSLEPNDLSVGLAYAARLGRFRVGVGAHYLQENLDIAKGTGFAYDLGVLMDVGPVRLGAAGTSLLGSLDYEGESYDIPQRVALGASFRPGWREVELTAQFSDRRYGDQDVSFGVEWTGLRGALSLRGGYVALTESGASESFSPYRFGFTVGAASLALDYAYVPHETLGQAHLIALRWTGR